MTSSKQRVLISILTWFFILIKYKPPSKTKHFNLIPIIFNSKARSCFLFVSMRKKLEKMLFQSNPNWNFFTGFLSSYWPEHYLFLTAFPITALLRLLAKCRKWEERWCADRIQTVKRSSRDLGSGIDEGRRGSMMQSQIKSVGDSPLTSAGVESKPNRQRGVKNEQWGMRKERTESDVERGKIPSAILAAALGKSIYSFGCQCNPSIPPLTLWSVTLKTSGRHRIFQLMLTARLLNLAKLFIYNTAPFSHASTIKYVISKLS